MLWNGDDGLLLIIHGTRFNIQKSSTTEVQLRVDTEAKLSWSGYLTKFNKINQCLFKFSIQSVEVTMCHGGKNRTFLQFVLMKQ